jgi:quinoprotein glucose dehydrogenase
MIEPIEARRSGRRARWRSLAGFACVLAVPSAYAHAVQSSASAPAPTVPAGQERTQSGGDPVRGRALVESSQCLDCHRIADTGSRLGPDLTEIGKLRSPEQLRRALLAPDAEVIPENRFVRIVTRNGTVTVGRLLNQDAFSVQLMDKDEQLKSYLKSDLREHAVIVKGMMPSYEGKLTAEQVADIVGYLVELKGSGK